MDATVLDLYLGPPKIENVWITLSTMLRIVSDSLVSRPPEALWIL